MSEKISIPNIGEFSVNEITDLLSFLSDHTRKFQANYEFRMKSHNSISTDDIKQNPALSPVLDRINYCLYNEEEAISGIITRRLCAFFDRREFTFLDR